MTNNANSATKPRMMPIKNLAKNGPVGVLKPRCTTTSERIDHWTKMRRLLAKFTPSSADFTTTTPELKFSVHTGVFGRPPRGLDFQRQYTRMPARCNGQNETGQPDHSASLGDSITSSTRIRFSVHTSWRSKSITRCGAILPQQQRDLDALSIFRPQGYATWGALLRSPTLSTDTQHRRCWCLSSPPATPTPNTYIQPSWKSNM